jgi:hypothetical protein
MSARSGPILTMWFWDIENERFSTWIVDGIAASREDRSECGWDVGCSVGSGLCKGWIAWVVSFSALSRVWGAGRARGWYASSIFVPMEGTVRLRGVFLVEGVIVQRN